MPRLNGTGPDGEGSQTGRKLGKCHEVPDEEKLNKLGKGAGVRRKSGGGEGKGKRLKSGKP
ncbi:MAG: DUF5320 domain-containing protein [Lentimicrobium sp.]|nr:DUF5320 domain-containing protein [Lentimicrobium sp.]